MEERGEHAFKLRHIVVCIPWVMSLLSNGLLGEVDADLQPQPTSLLGLPSLLVDMPQSEEPVRQRTWLSGRDFDGRAVYLSRRRQRATLVSASLHLDSGG